MYTQNDVSPPRLSLVHPASPDLPRMLPRAPSSGPSYPETASPSYGSTPTQRVTASISPTVDTGRTGASFAQQLYASYAKPQPASAPVAVASRTPVTEDIARVSSPGVKVPSTPSSASPKNVYPLETAQKNLLPAKTPFSPHQSAFGKLPEDNEWSPASLYNSRVAPSPRGYSSSRPSTASGASPSQSFNSAPHHPTPHRGQTFQGPARSQPSPATAHPHHRSATFSGGIGEPTVTGQAREIRSIAVAPVGSSNPSGPPFSSSSTPHVTTLASVPPPGVQQGQGSYGIIPQYASPLGSASSTGTAFSPGPVSPGSYPISSAPAVQAAPVPPTSPPLQLQQQYVGYKASPQQIGVNLRAPSVAAATQNVGKAVGKAVGVAVGKAVLRGMFGAAGDIVGSVISDTVVDAAAGAIGSDTGGDVTASAVGAITSSLISGGDGTSAVTDTFVAAVAGGDVTQGLAGSFTAGMFANGGDPTGFGSDALISSLTSGMAGLSTGDATAGFDPSSFINPAGGDAYQSYFQQALEQQQANQPNFADILQQMNGQTNDGMQQFQQIYQDSLNTYAQQAQQFQQTYQDSLNQQMEQTQQFQQAYQDQFNQQMQQYQQALQGQTQQQQQSQTYQPSQNSYQPPQNQTPHTTQAHSPQNVGAGQYGTPNAAGPANLPAPGRPPGAGHYGVPGQPSPHLYSQPVQGYSGHSSANPTHTAHMSKPPGASGFHRPTQSTHHRQSISSTPGRNLIDPSLMGLYNFDVAANTAATNAV
ncbi:hypothetical protein HGRIS_009169 [Hohenbuehelia grisea]